jgi:hypothetical protein
MAGLPKDDSLAGPAFLITKRKEEYKMFDLGFKELLLLAIVIIPLALLMTGIVCFFFYTVGLIIKDKFEHMHLRHRKAH